MINMVLCACLIFLVISPIPARSSSIQTEDSQGQKARAYLYSGSTMSPRPSVRPWVNSFKTPGLREEFSYRRNRSHLGPGHGIWRSSTTRHSEPSLWVWGGSPSQFGLRSGPVWSRNSSRGHGAQTWWMQPMPWEVSRHVYAGYTKSLSLRSRQHRPW